MELALILLFRALMYFLKFYFLLLLARILLYWLPNVSIYQQPWYSLIRVTDPYLKLFRDSLPFTLGVDISPIFAFLFIQLIIELLPLTANLLTKINFAI
uniref:Ycf19 n=2 Tax=Pavlovaceae TaxID=418969 RepID=M1K406_DIALT|nr:Ycf19 [Diacronema lutheri]YP_009863741.1 ycf19 [Pavlova sp. NIVA-4/92]AGE93826.1 Ycf19 [Diacronema lutheri]QKE31072.1 ycf19 [Pavlova sp. NIVA-4/92]|mmetsp:Transcript_11107/g.35064  ORF Transcript_11107/g.35064 Transcript_11107/m.35064 type:complete len:99 (-) Transcript_11107:1612-1908(-)